jgi:two-component system, NtrC family, sensor kinase
VRISVVLQRRATRSISLLGRLLILALAIGLIAVAEVWHRYDHAQTTAERIAEGLARLLAEQAERSIQAIDLTLLGLIDALRVAPNLAPNDPAFQGAMEQRLKHLPYVRGLFVVGRDGLVTHDTGYPELPALNLSDRAYFRVHLEKAENTLHISDPLKSKQTGSWFVSFSRRITDADGSFGGAVVAVVEPRYFQRFYEALPMGTDNTIALVLPKGTLLAHHPEHDESAGLSYMNSPIRPLALARGHGVEWAKSPVDGVKRLVGYRMVTSGSVIVLAGLSERTIYAAWHMHSAIMAGTSLVVWLLAAGIAVTSHIYRRRADRAQARMAQSQRLETVGRIAGGIAHDLGNTIKIARTTFTLLKPSLSAQSDAMALVEDADRSLKSAFEIIDRLLAFARKQDLSPLPTDLAELIDGFAPILRQAAGPCIELTLDLRKALVCSIDPIHLESALLNLVLNSRDAMPRGGRIAIELRDAEPPRRRSWMPSLVAPVPCLWAEIAVKDDGAGMPREVLDRVFEPFFTTRSNGSGLGLSQVLGFVEQSAGEVVIDSREGRGTTVRLRFPRASVTENASDPPDVAP